MLESELVYEIVANKALKGFCFKNGRIIPKMELTLEDNKALESALSQICGKDCKKWIQDLDLDKLKGKPFGQIDIADIAPGSIVKLELSHKEILEIVYLGSYKFSVCRDSVGIFRPLDVLKALTLFFERGCAAYFQVFRNDCPYPEKGLLFKAVVQSITLLNTNVVGTSLSQYVNETSICSLQQVFAWKADNYPIRFTEEQLTDNNQAVFIIDLMQGEYWVNSDYSKYKYSDLVSILKVACNISRTGNGLTNKTRGKLYLSKNSNRYFFYIGQKAEIEI